jgi:hypothetical protein
MAWFGGLKIYNLRFGMAWFEGLKIDNLRFGMSWFGMAWFGGLKIYKLRFGMALGSESLGSGALRSTTLGSEWP